MERSEPTPVLPIVSTRHAQLATHVTIRRNKMMSSEFYHLKALGGSSTKLPPRDAIVAIAIFYQSTRGIEYKLPPRDAIIAHAIFTPKHTGARVQNLPPKDVIIAHAARNLKGSNQKTHRQAPPIELCPKPKGKTRLQPD